MTNALELLFEDRVTAADGEGVLVIDEHSGRKYWGKKTAHVGKQWLGNFGKTENGVVSVSSLLAEEEESAEGPEGDLRAGAAGKGKKGNLGVLAGGAEGGEGVAATVGDAVALLEGVLRSAPTTGATSAA